MNTNIYNNYNKFYRFKSREAISLTPDQFGGEGQKMIDNHIYQEPIKNKSGRLVDFGLWDVEDVKLLPKEKQILDAILSIFIDINQIDINSKDNLNYIFDNHDKIFPFRVNLFDVIRLCNNGKRAKSNIQIEEYLEYLDSMSKQYVTLEWSNTLTAKLKDEEKRSANGKRLCQISRGEHRQTKFGDGKTFKYPKLINFTPIVKYNNDSKKIKSCYLQFNCFEDLPVFTAYEMFSGDIKPIDNSKRFTSKSLPSLLTPVQDTLTDEINQANYKIISGKSEEIKLNKNNHYLVINIDGLLQKFGLDYEGKNSNSTRRNRKRIIDKIEDILSDLLKKDCYKYFNNFRLVDRYGFERKDNKRRPIEYILFEYVTEDGELIHSTIRWK